jgi:uncharacterized protein (DUF1684 family)
MCLTTFGRGPGRYPRDVEDGGGDYAAEIEAWHAARDTRLRSPESWIALTALHWLTPGAHELGQHPSSAIRLEGHDVPPLAGHLLVTDALQATIRPHHGAPLFHDGQPITAELPLVDDTNGDPTIVELGSLRMHLIRRGVNGDRLALRVRDAQAAALVAFEGIPHFPIDPEWRVTGYLERGVGRARTIAVADVIGDVLEEASPGTVVLPLPGSGEGNASEYRLHALQEDENRLWLIFGDATNGAETYVAGRFLVTEPVEDDGSVVVDFNRTYNMPCVFSPYATCPLPPEGNRLPVRVTAGEMLPRWADGWHPQPAPVPASVRPSAD